MSYPQNVGIKAMEIYVPGQTLDQKQFEVHQGVSAGKYTIGLGLTSMNFCNDREDVCTLALTAVSSLLRKYSIDTNSIGRLEVGTESPIDKAKSVKSVLMQLFGDNTSIEGVDTVHACYGGTNALFNAINWVESRSWDGRDAIVVASDIATYKEPSARPTGGAGCIALLIGPDAPIVSIPGLRGTYMAHSFDFYKPDMSTEYPYLDGHLSISSYLTALDGCYADLIKRTTTKMKPQLDPSTAEILSRPRETFIDIFDFMAFHTPNCKLVSKSYGRLFYNDFLSSPTHERFSTVPASFRAENLSKSESLQSKQLERTFVDLSKSQFSTRVEPSIRAPTRCGNMYTASLYCSLLSLISSVDASELVGKTIGMFSYGSGMASTLFGLKVVGNVGQIVEKIDLWNVLDERKVVGATEYEEARKMREEAYGKKEFVPRGGLEGIGEGVWFIEGVDGEFRRKYGVMGRGRAKE